jgi:hypothetical protein
MAVLARPLHSKHSLQNTKEFSQRCVGQTSQTFDEAISIDCPQLISHHVPILAVESAAHTKGVWMTTCCERRYNESTEMRIQLIWRDNNAGPCFPDFRSTRWIQGNKKDVPP